MKKYEYVILGGGVAGLCAAKRFIELGIHPLVIEAGSYPSHKVCGELISPSGVKILEKWGIHPVPIDHLHLHTSNQTLHFKFPSPAGSLSHLSLDTQLAEQISQQGATILTGTKVQHLTPALSKEDFHTLQIPSGETILAKNLLIAVGRLPSHISDQTKPIRYKGIKAHFSGIELATALEMFAFSGSYLGLSPIENGGANLACLAKIEKVKQFSSSQDFIENLIQQHPLLHRLLSSANYLFDRWMEADIPEFGWRSPPNWPNCYWIGDSASTIPPASGNGLSLALASGYLAAEFASRKEVLLFKSSWRKRCSSQILFGKILHRLFLNPFLSQGAIYVNRCVPSLAQHFFLLTRDPGF